MVYSRDPIVCPENNKNSTEDHINPLWGTPTKEAIDEFQIYVEAIYLTSEEREKFLKVEHEFLFEQLDLAPVYGLDFPKEGEIDKCIGNEKGTIRSPDYIETLLSNTIYNDRIRRIRDILRKDKDWLKTRPTKDDEECILELLTDNPNILGPKHLKKLLEEHFVLEGPCLDSWVLAINKVLRALA